MHNNIKQWCLENWYTLLDSIPNDWDRYWDWIPSVTTILSLIYDKWFEYVKRNHVEALKKACIRWKKVHWDAEDFFDWNSPTIHKQIMKFHSLYNIEIKWQEINCRSDIQWTIDLVCFVWELNVDMNIDYKSSKKKSKKYFLQCGWYEYLNWLRWAVLYLWDKDFDLQVCPLWYKELFIELKDYFLTLLKNDNLSI